MFGRRRPDRLPRSVIYITRRVTQTTAIPTPTTLRGTFRKSEISREEVMTIMSGGEDLKAP